MRTSRSPALSRSELARSAGGGMAWNPWAMINPSSIFERQPNPIGDPGTFCTWSPTAPCPPGFRRVGNTCCLGISPPSGPSDVDTPPRPHGSPPTLPPPRPTPPRPTGPYPIPPVGTPLPPRPAPSSVPRLAGGGRAAGVSFAARNPWPNPGPVTCIVQEDAAGTEGAACCEQDGEVVCVEARMENPGAFSALPKRSGFWCEEKAGVWWCHDVVECEPNDLDNPDPDCVCGFTPEGGCKKHITWRPNIDPEPAVGSLLSARVPNGGGAEKCWSDDGVIYCMKTEETTCSYDVGPEDLPVEAPCTKVFVWRPNIDPQPSGNTRPSRVITHGPPKRQRTPSSVSARPSTAAPRPSARPTAAQGPASLALRNGVPFTIPSRPLPPPPPRAAPGVTPQFRTIRNPGEPRNREQNPPPPYPYYRGWTAPWGYPQPYQPYGWWSYPSYYWPGYYPYYPTYPYWAYPYYGGWWWGGRRHGRRGGADFSPPHGIGPGRGQLWTGTSGGFGPGGAAQFGGAMSGGGFGGGVGGFSGGGGFGGGVGGFSGGGGGGGMSGGGGGGGMSGNPPVYNVHYQNPSHTVAGPMMPRLFNPAAQAARTDVG